MGIKRTAWHVLFVDALIERAPRSVEIRWEVPLSKEPLRADTVLLRRLYAEAADEGARDADARTLRELWRHLVKEAVLEFKSLSAPFQPGDLAKLFGYGGQYHALRFEEIGAASNLLLVLVVPEWTSTLRAEVAALGLSTSPVAPGYARAEGVPYALLIVDLSAVVAADRDELMEIFIRYRMLNAVAQRWLEDRIMHSNARSIEDMEGYDDVLDRLLESLPPERRLRGLGPEERLRGLGPEEQLLALSEEVLRGLPDVYLRTLSAPIQEAIRKRIGRSF